MKTLLALAAAVILAPGITAQTVDQHWLGIWNQAQALRPPALAAHARIAPPDEPGTPLVIRGQVLAADGTTPMANAVVFAYHTDAKGKYTETPDTVWRLHGWTETDRNGRFEFETIRPAPYPNRNVPAHVHFTVETRAFGRQWAGLLFADDALVSVAERDDSRRAGIFGQMLDVVKEAHGQRVDLKIKLKPKGEF